MGATHTRVEVNDLMQQGDVYVRTEPVGRNFHSDFRLELTPKEMLALGVFGGRYMPTAPPNTPRTGSRAHACVPGGTIRRSHCFGVNASQPLSVWRAKGWISEAFTPIRQSGGCSCLQR